MRVEFFEKPGCINNTKQKQMLKEHGHTVIAHSILTEAWTADTLRPYFGSLPLDKWFNVSAPSIKNGKVNPSLFTEETAIAAMIHDHLLIKRPLIAVGEHKACGFDHPLVKELTHKEEVSSLLSCPNAKNNCD